MRRILASLSVFFGAFVLGYLLVPGIRTTVNDLLRPNVVQHRFIPWSYPLDGLDQESFASDGEDAITDLDHDEPKFDIKLLETGDGFHGDQVDAKTGEVWFGLFKGRDHFYFRRTKLKVTLVNDPIVDDENDKTGKKVETSIKDPAVFLLKDANRLREGKIQTVFYASEPEEATNLKNGTVKKFDLGGTIYEMAVVNEGSKDEFLGKGSKLILKRNGQVQVLRDFRDGCDDCYWNLYWAGDIDHDGELDLYLDLSGHYNVTDRRLYLSSEAEESKIVNYVANFWTNGC